MRVQQAGEGKRKTKTGGDRMRGEGLRPVGNILQTLSAAGGVRQAPGEDSTDTFLHTGDPPMTFYQIVFSSSPTRSSAGWGGPLYRRRPPQISGPRRAERSALPFCTASAGWSSPLPSATSVRAGSSCLYSAPSMPRSSSGSAGTFWSTRPIPGGGITAPCRSIWTAMSASARR